MSRRYPANVLPEDQRRLANYIRQSIVQSANIDNTRRRYPNVPIPNKIAMINYTDKALNQVYQNNDPARRLISQTRLGKKGI